MTRASGLRLLLVIGVLVLGIGWILREMSAEDVAVPDEAPTAVEEAPLAITSWPAAVLATAPSDAARAADAPTRAAIAGDQAASAAPISDAELAQAVWVEGRIVFPADTPADERVEIVARGRKFANKELHRASVAADGRFRVAFEARTKQGWLDLQARYLHLPEPHSLRPAEKRETELVLEPQLGARLLGRCVLTLAPSSRVPDLSSSAVSLSAVSGSTSESALNLFQRHTKLDHELGFELGGLPPGKALRLQVAPLGATEVQREIAALHAGETRTVDIAISLGATLRGRVLDEAGGALAGAEFSLLPSGVMFAAQPRAVGKARSGAEGAFEITGVAAGDWDLTAKLAGFVPTKLELDDVVDGMTRDGLDFKLSRGSSIRGRVAWPDGAPVADAELSCSVLQRAVPAAPRIARSAADGTFMIDALEPEGSYRISARARREDAAEGSSAVAAEPASESAGEGAAEPASKSAGGVGAEPAGESAKKGAADEPPRTASGERAGSAASLAEPRERGPLPSTKNERSGRRAGRGTSGQAQADISPGAAEVVLVLRGGVGIEGLVLDDTGRPLATFEVSAQPSDRLRAWDESEDRVRQSFDGGGSGRFALEGLREGDWDVRAGGPGFVESSPVRVRVPLAGPPLELRLTRASKLAGRIVGTAGEPIAGARVETAPVAASPGGLPGRAKQDTVCDEQGAFELRDVAPGPQHVIASAEGWGDSEPLLVDLAPADERSGVVIALRRGGRLTGEVLDEQGRPDAGRRVHLFLPGAAARRSFPMTVTDANGRFEYAVLAPGKYWITAMQRQVFEPQGGKRDHRRTPAPERAIAEVEEGTTVHVRIGAPGEVAVRVHGVVRSRGAAIEGVEVRSMQPPANERRTTSDSAGRYVLELPRAGTTTISLRDGSSSTGRTVTVPEDVKEYELDLELPGGSVRGRVIGPDGKPVAGVFVTLGVDRANQERSSRFTHGWQQSEEDGSFAFASVYPGTYRLQAGNAGDGSRFGGSLGIAIRDGLAVGEDSRLEVELRLPEGCTVQGLVLDLEGRPAIGASVFGRDERGAAFRPNALATTDASGRFRIDGLPEGRASFFARTNSSASEESSPLLLRAEGAGEVELRLRAATRVYVAIEEADGKKVGAQVRVFDAAGRESSGFWAVSSVPGQQELPGQLVGTLPPGSYRVVATNHSGKSVEQALVLHGEEKVGVVLKY